MLAGLCIALLLLLLASGMPVGFALGFAGGVGLYALGGLTTVLGILKTTPLASVDSYELVSIPMFLLMANFVIVSRVADEMFETAAAWLGRLPGGLAYATALTGAAFGAISGSSTAAAATLSATSIPGMVSQGYEPRLAAGVVAISGTLAMLIPPSVSIVLYAILADESIGQLLIAGIVPGLLVTLAIMLTVLVLIKLDPRRAPQGRSYSWREKLLSLRSVAPFLLLFSAVTGAIYLGVATPTEAAGMGAFCAGALAVARRCKAADLFAAAMSAARASCMIGMIILGAHVFGYFLTLTQTTQSLVQAIADSGASREVILIAILALFLVLGCFMDQVAILILTVPILLPVIKALGYDPIWFGIITIVMAEIGMVTPPLGLNVFVVSRYTGMPAAEVFRGVAPHVAAHLVLVALLCALPGIILWLPSTMSP